MYAKKSRRKRAIVISAIASLVFSMFTGFPTESQAAAAKVTYTGSAGAPEHKLSLWYQSPATNWESQALPIGNGSMGGMVFGGVDQEHIQFNEKTLWTGGPNSTRSYTFGNRDGAASHLASVRSKLDAGDVNGAGDEASSYLTGTQTGFGDYQNFGDMYFDLALPSAITVSDYRRELDLQDGIARVSYTYDGVDYLREYFVSYPDNVMVMRFTASQEGKISLDVRPTSAQGGAVTASGDTITIRGNVSNNQMLYESQVKVLNEGGTITPGTGKINVSGANALTVILAAGTDYVNEYPTYKGADPHNWVTSTINSASSKLYATLKNNHTNDYQALFNRVTLNLGESTPQIPTNQLLSTYSTTKDKALEVLFYQYGRYLLISSSRSGSLPANLQGVWNNSNTPPWDSDYHFNINVQMNYWPAEVANLDETMVPLIDYVESLLAPGRVSAEKHYGVTGGGWTVNTMNNPFGFTAPGWGFYWGWAPGANAFIANNVWEYYKFSGDTAKLNRIYPILKEASEFWIKYLVKDSDGTLVSSPCYSPEQGDISKGCAFDQQLVWDLFTNTIEASQKLNVDEAFRNEIIAKRDMLSPIKVGRYGQIQEWKQDIDDPNNTHRHVSQLVGLFPGKQINKDTPEWFDAAKVTLEHRGDDGTGWSKANKINLWARLLDGNHAHTILQGQLMGSTLSNLFDTHPPFQIDGNFGATSGISEMLLQSHLDNIHILPALPSSWSDGSYSGLKARNGFEVGVSWAQSRATSIKIKSLAGSRAVLYYPNIKGAAVVDQNGTPVTYTTVSKDQIEFNTQVGSTYTVNSIPSAPPGDTIVKVDDRDASVTYNGAWSNYNDGSDYLGTEKYSSAAGSYAQFTFTGTSIKYISMKQQNMGIVDVYLDGVLAQGDIDLYASKTTKQVVAYSKAGLPYASHTIKVVNKGTKNPASLGTIAAVDAFEYSYSTDNTAPVTKEEITPSQPDGLNGWYVHPVTLKLSATDDASGVSKTEYSLDDGTTWQSYTSEITFEKDGVNTISYRSTDNAGNVEEPQNISINLDTTAPAITVTGFEHDMYSDAEDITPVITLSDDLSGVDNSKTTVTVDTYAIQQGSAIHLYTLPLGSHELTVTASDLAGNTVSKTVSFQTTTSVDSLKALVTNFKDAGWIDNAGIVNSLQRKLDANALEGFANEVKAQSGKHISSKAADYLLRDAQYLLYVK
ncbi:glycoside hydrolase N-terminal domain-containing protein [Paenibacillus sp. KQZ6P-2]|uniref:Glycoside hydrolase N-terminal domain-containing protein n=1 Tax=Paenibacillus mangrovi TaxID=2931978 RepID=A0A9X1WN25_9BACL|nr:glycoside hydrolase N-terminal domain-containing protein [Paenibacillus mangrovi]MCJ8011516.1 glycoside hydrolase N-terminal domain-containing protein [Paenibacillus mangrovi]